MPAPSMWGALADAPTVKVIAPQFCDKCRAVWETMPTDTTTAFYPDSWECREALVIAMRNYYVSEGC